jgi:hypothetical protein
MNSSHRQPERPLIPPEYSGKWVAWSSDQTTIVATGRTFAEARAAALAAGESRPLLEKAPKIDVRFVGRS